MRAKAREGTSASVEWAEGEEDGTAQGGGFWSRFRRGPHHFEADEESEAEGDGAV